jgi:hypothetical protein
MYSSTSLVSQLISHLWQLNSQYLPGTFPIMVLRLKHLDIFIYLYVSVPSTSLLSHCRSALLCSQMVDVILSNNWLNLLIDHDTGTLNQSIFDLGISLKFWMIKHCYSVPCSIPARNASRYSEIQKLRASTSSSSRSTGCSTCWSQQASGSTGYYTHTSCSDHCPDCKFWRSSTGICRTILYTQTFLSFLLQSAQYTTATQPHRTANTRTDSQPGRLGTAGSLVTLAIINFCFARLSLQGNHHTI